MPSELLCIAAFVNLLICVPLGVYVGGERGAPLIGGLMGLLFGPIGLIIAAVIDCREMCRRCNTRLNGQPNICPGCGCESPLEEIGTPLTRPLPDERPLPPRSPPAAGGRR